MRPAPGPRLHSKCCRELPALECPSRRGSPALVQARPRPAEPSRAQPSQGPRNKPGGAGRQSQPKGSGSPGPEAPPCRLLPRCARLPPSRDPALGRGARRSPRGRSRLRGITRASAPNPDPWGLQGRGEQGGERLGPPGGARAVLEESRLTEVPQDGLQGLPRGLLQHQRALRGSGQPCRACGVRGPGKSSRGGCTPRPHQPRQRPSRRDTHTQP